MLKKWGNHILMVKLWFFVSAAAAAWCADILDYLHLIFFAVIMELFPMGLLEVLPVEWENDRNALRVSTDSWVIIKVTLFLESQARINPMTEGEGTTGGKAGDLEEGAGGACAGAAAAFSAACFPCWCEALRLRGIHIILWFLGTWEVSSRLRSEH